MLHYSQIVSVNKSSIVALAKQNKVLKKFPPDCNPVLKCMVLSMAGQLTADSIVKNGLTVEAVQAFDLLIST